MADVKMVSLTIEGRPVTVPDGMSILEAAKTAGVLIPHYCYHPGLPVAGVCRMCLVEVEKFPKLAPACATSVGEGQVVHVHSAKALEAAKAYSSSSSSIIHSTARSVIRLANASCRTTRSPKDALIRATASRSVSTRSRISAAMCCMCRIAASSARVAFASDKKLRV